MDGVNTKHGKSEKFFSDFKGHKDGLNKRTPTVWVEVPKAKVPH
jgi:hypothetical protein